MFKIIGSVLLLVAATLLVKTFRHYHDSYSGILPAPDGWTRIASRHFDPDELGDMAPTLRDWVGRVGESGLEVMLSTKTLPPFTELGLDTVAEAARAKLETMQGAHDARSCREVESDGVRWICVQWRLRRGDYLALQRSYIARRGSSLISVRFIAIPEERFGNFGEPSNWLADLKWQGPGIAYSY